MEGIEIREADCTDARQMLNYLMQVGAETDNLTFGAEGLPITEEDEAQYLQKVRQDPHSVIFAAIREGRIVGDVSSSGLSRRMSHRAELGISVIKSEWNRGIGSALMQRAITYARQNGMEVISLEVKADSLPAIRLYERFGFKQIGHFPAFFKIGNEYADFILMHSDLRNSQTATCR